MKILRLGAFALCWGHLSLRGQDITAPTLASVGSADGTYIGLAFSESIDATLSEDEFYYEVEDTSGLSTITRVTLRPDGRSVMIELTRPVSGEFTVRVFGVTDVSGNQIAPGAAITGRVSTTLAVTDIGDVFPAGAVVAFNESQFTVIGGGDNIGGTADQFTYVYTARTNDFDVRVRVDGLLFVGQATAKAGLVMRESLAPDARMVAVYATPTNGANYVQARTRGIGGAPAMDYWTQNELNTFPIWLRLKRAGSAFSVYTSRDGGTWEPMGPPQPLFGFPAVALIGMGATSRSPGTATEAEYAAFGETPLYPDALISITRQPNGAVTEENTRASFSVSAAVVGAPAEAVAYQWQAEANVGSGMFTNLFFATESSYVTPFLTAAENGQRFRVLVSVTGGSVVISDIVTVIVNPDVTGPRAVSATGMRSRREIVIEFSEALDPVSAQISSHYTVAGLAVTNATLDASGARVTLALNAPQTVGGSNLVEISGVRDRAGRLTDPNPQSLPAPAYVLGRGFAVQDLYFNLPGNLISDLRAAPGFPNAPHETSYVDLLEGPRDAYENYGTRVTGFLVPPRTGSYNFFLASDDQGEFWLSTDEDPSHLRRMCYEAQWMHYRYYTNITSVWGDVLRNAAAPENRSSTLFPAGVQLVAGQLYYFEALSKEGGGGDNLSVAWQLPGGPLPATGALPIPSESLATLSPPGGTIQITEHPHDVHYVFDPPFGATIHDETFAAGDGGYSVINSGNPEGPWTYAPADGRWTANGSGNLDRLSSSSLISPPILITRAGPLVLRFDHRYSFEYDGTRWDGGQVRLSLNGGEFRPLAGARFCANGYVGVLTGESVLQGQEAFNADSLGYAAGALITSAINLGHFNAGDQIQVQFLGAWDPLVQGSLPNWLIDRVSVSEGECAAPVMFTVGATGSLPGVARQPIHYQWQRDCGAGFTNITGATSAAYSFVPAFADLLCQFRCVVSVPGISATSAVARVTITRPSLSASRAGTNVVISWSGPGTLQVAQFIAGPWAVAGGVTNTTHHVRPSAAQRFYRLRIP